MSSKYEIELIDVLAQPERAEAAHIFATPTTIRIAPEPTYRVIGDLSDPHAVMIALGLDAIAADFAAETAVS